MNKNKKLPTKEEIIEKISNEKKYLSENFFVTEIGLFGLNYVYKFQGFTMKNSIVLFSFILFLIISNNLFGADENTTKTSDNSVYFGIGTTISPISNIYLPIQLGNNLRVEPMIGISMSDRSTIQDTLIKSDVVYNNNSYKFGIGVFYTFHPIKMTSVYTGLRFTNVYTTYTNYYRNTRRIDSNTISIESSNSVSKQKSYILGAVIGAEIYATKQFSVGIEAQFNYTRYSTPNQSDLQVNAIYTKYDYYSINNSCLIFARYYFNY